MNTGRSIHVIALTRMGGATGARIATALATERECALLLPSKYGDEIEGAQTFDKPVGELIGELWPATSGLVCVMAAGIAVRSIAALLKGKAADPPVLVVDPSGGFVVPILSGHLGGANALAEELGDKLSITPVITTATEALGKPALEVWAAEAGLTIEDKRTSLAVNSAWANGEPVGCFIDPELEGFGPVAKLAEHIELLTHDLKAWEAFGGVKFAVSHRLGDGECGAGVVRPPVLVCGVGCRKAASPEEVAGGIKKAMAKAGLSLVSVAAIASVDLKKDEPALLLLAKELGVGLETFPSEKLAQVETPTPSAKVLQEVGTTSVSEAAAILGSGGEKLVMDKIKGKSWTLAVGFDARNWSGKG